MRKGKQRVWYTVTSSFCEEPLNFQRAGEHLFAQFDPLGDGCVEGEEGDDSREGGERLGGDGAGVGGVLGAIGVERREEAVERSDAL